MRLKISYKNVRFVASWGGHNHRKNCVPCRASSSEQRQVTRLHSCVRANERKVSNRFRRSWNVERMAVETTSAHLYVCLVVSLNEICVTHTKTSFCSVEKKLWCEYCFNVTNDESMSWCDNKTVATTQNSNDKHHLCTFNTDTFDTLIIISPTNVFYTLMLNVML